MSRSIPPRSGLSTRANPAGSHFPALTTRGRDRVLDKVAQLRDIRLPERWALARAAPDDDRLSADSRAKTSPGVVELGDLVTVEFTAAHGLRRRRTVEKYVLVHPAEAHLDQLRISVESPFARAVLGQPVGARVDVHAPAGRYGVRIVATEAAPDGR